MTDTTVSTHEADEVAAANATGKQPVVFVHGLWLLPSSWDRWAKLFDDAGYVSVLPHWPDDPETVAEANADPNVFAGKGIGEIADHLEAVVAQLERKPAIIGHSFGGLMAQILAGRGRSAATVAIDAAPFRGVLPLPISALKSAFPGARQPAEPEQGRAADVRPVPLRVHERGQRGRGEGSCTRRTPSRRPASRCSRRHRRTSTRGPRRRSTPRTPIAGRSCSSRARRTTPSRGRSRRLRTTSRRTTPGSPRSSRSRAAGTRSRSTAAGRRSRRPRSRSSSASSSRGCRVRPPRPRRNASRWTVASSSASSRASSPSGSRCSSCSGRCAREACPRGRSSGSSRTSCACFAR